MMHILLVEDNPNDALLIREALKDLEKTQGIANTLKIATDGDTALQVLYSAEFRPHIVLLDLNLPKKSGFEVLKEIKRDASLRPIPVIILTNSRSEDDVLLAYASYCNAYVRKPLDYEIILETMTRLGKFWFESASLARQGSIDVSILPPSDENP